MLYGNFYYAVYKMSCTFQKFLPLLIKFSVSKLSQTYQTVKFVENFTVNVTKNSLRSIKSDNKKKTLLINGFSMIIS